MGHMNFARTPKTEELQEPGAIEDCHNKTHHDHRVYAEENDIMEKFEGILDVDEAENLQEGFIYNQTNWDFMASEGFPMNEDGDEQQKFDNSIDSWRLFQEDDHFSINGEEHAFSEDDEKKFSLNLSLNYQEVLEAWSDRTLWADDGSFPSSNSSCTREVPIMKEERRRREASVLRYKEKRQSRLFSKKIRYEVRKLNADKRPRVKGRFVKRVPEKKLK